MYFVSHIYHIPEYSYQKLSFKITVDKLLDKVRVFETRQEKTQRLDILSMIFQHW